MHESDLFPRPRSFAVTSGLGPRDEAVTSATLDESLPAQGYRITTEPQSISVSHRDAAGLRYALSTLDQLRALPDFASTSVEITDWPDFTTRCFMLDISRDRVPTRATLARFVDVMEVARMNQFELYMEHTFAYTGHEDVWADASPLTAADMLWLDGLCASKGIALVANQNTLGHMERWLRTEAHAFRAELPGGAEFFGRHKPANTLEPTAENADFVGGLLTELASVLRTRRINVGGDEPWELGRGSSAAEVAKRGKGAVYLDYLNRVVGPWLEAGYQVEFWADVLADDPEAAASAPRGAIPIVWHYEPAALARDVWAAASAADRLHWAEIGLEMESLGDGFAGRVRHLAGAGIPFWVAAGAGNWVSFVGRLDAAMENMRDAAEVGLAHGAEGYVVTSWGDLGHWDAPSVSFAPLIYGGAVAWSAEANAGIDLRPVLDERVFFDEASLLGDVLVRMGSTTAIVGAPILGASPAALAFVLGGDLGTLPDLSVERILLAESVLQECRDDLDRATPASGDGAIVIRELRHAIDCSVLGFDICIAGGVGGLGPDAATQLSDRFDLILAEQRACWALRSRPGGLDDSIAVMSDLGHALRARSRSDEDENAT